MILAIDVGNTNIVLGTIENGEIRTILRLHTNLQATSSEYAISLSQLLKFYEVDPKGFEGTILSSVVPPVTEALKGALRQLTGRDCTVVGPGMKTGMNMRIDDPGTLAGDVLVGEVAAMNSYGCPVIVMDLGTANTVTVVDKDGAFRGGAILPGIKLGYAALAAGTSLLPDISITPPPKAVASNTVDCMRSGAVFGTAAILDGLSERMEAELGYPCTLVATGGLASSIIPYCRREIVCDDDLLLKGLWILWEKNRK